MNWKEPVIVIGTAMVLSLGARSLLFAQQHDATDPATGQQQMDLEQRAGPIMKMTAGEIRGETIYNAAGDELGRVDKVVTDQDRQLNVVLSVGGFLGLGRRDVVVPLSQLNHTGGRITTTSSSVSAKMLTESAEYSEDAYNEISGDVRLADVVRQHGQQSSEPPLAGEQAMGTELAGFEELDTDGNGFVTRQEAGSREPLLGNWQVVDINSDDQLDEAEFGAFEAGFRANVEARQQIQRRHNSNRRPHTRKPQTSDVQGVRLFSSDENELSLSREKKIEQDLNLSPLSNKLETADPKWVTCAIHTWNTTYRDVGSEDYAGAIIFRPTRM